MDERIATCLFLDAESSGLSVLHEHIQYEVSMANQVVDCLQIQASCDQGEFMTCVQNINFKSCIEEGELNCLNNQCFVDPQTFTCGDGTELSRELVCDGNEDCFDGEDERADCSPPYTCNDGSSILAAWLCDGTADCADGDDEVQDSCP